MSSNNLLAGAVALSFVVGSSALAADLPSRKYDLVAPLAPAFTWTGFDVGANAGVAWTHGTTRLAPFDPRWFDIIDQFGGWRKSGSDIGFSGGGQLGYDYQFGSIVLGAETDFNHVDAKSRLNGQGGFSLADLGTVENAFSARSRVAWFGTLRARIGLAPMERLMVYGTGGLAYGLVKSTAVETIGLYDLAGTNVFSLPSTGSKSGTRLGWTLGSGAEYALTDHVSVKAEYLYVDLGGSASIPLPPWAPPRSASIAARSSAWPGRASITASDRVGVCDSPRMGVPPLRHGIPANSPVAA
ncbi:porin family protein [Bosea minatitlanensis]